MSWWKRVVYRSLVIIGRLISGKAVTRKDPSDNNYPLS